MKKQVEPIILVVFLLLLAIGAALLAYLYPSETDITGIKSLAAMGKPVKVLKADEVAASLAVWSSPILWDEPSSHNRLFSSDTFLFYPVAYPNGKYIVPVNAGSKSPSGVLLKWYDDNHLDFTDAYVDQEDPDGDGFSNIVEYKNEPVGVRYNAIDCDPAKATNPNDPKSHPDYLSRLRLQKIETQPFHILFNGYQQLNGVYLFQLHLSDVPSFKQPSLLKIGDPLPGTGYVIGPFIQKRQMIPDPHTGVPVDTDVSTLELDQPDTGQKVILPFRKEINSPDVTADFVMLMPTERDKVIRILVGKTFSVPFIPGVSFLVIDATDKGATIKNLTTGKVYSILLLIDKEWDDVPKSPTDSQP